MDQAEKKVVELAIQKLVEQDNETIPERLRDLEARLQAIKYLNAKLKGDN
jgi:hypothetical protein